MPDISASQKDIGKALAKTLRENPERWLEISHAMCHDGYAAVAIGSELAFVTVPPDFNPSIHCIATEAKLIPIMDFLGDPGSDPPAELPGAGIAFRLLKENHREPTSWI